MRPMRIDQLLPSIAYGDGVSNDAIALMKVIRSMGFESNIFAENIHPKLQNFVKKISDYKNYKKTDIMLYHFAIGSHVNDYAMNLRNVRKIMKYHNITPGHFIKSHNDEAYKLTTLGREQLERSNICYEMALADSEFNRRELDELGYINTHILPILINFDDYEQAPDRKIINQYCDEKINLVFVGRIVPNKKQEDIIKTFYYYKNYVNPNSRLFLVGSYNGMERYYKELLNLINHLKLNDVIFTGHTPFNHILSYYHLADVFVCMSEHEGFCIPLVESMYFRIPIVAYDSCAVPETLGNSGVLLKNKDYILAAETINVIIENSLLRESIVEQQSIRLEHFNNECIINDFKRLLNLLIG